MALSDLERADMRIVDRMLRGSASYTDHVTVREWPSGWLKHLIALHATAGHPQLTATVADWVHY